MDGVPGDLQGKYQKIAAEYAKVCWHVCHVIYSLKVSSVLQVIVHKCCFCVSQIRAQAGVLKKAVLEEQTRNAELRDILKEKEQILRKAEQEMDSLTFRNQQLTKRVTVLQDELDHMQVWGLF